MKKTLLILGLLAFGFAACSPSGGGGFRLLMQDQPIDDMAEVWVTFGGITLFKEGEAPATYETKIDGEPVRVDLLTLTDGTLEVIYEGDIPNGTYTQIRLILTKATYVAKGDENGTEIDLFVPSGEIKIPVEFEIESGKLTEVTVDFDAEESIHIHPTGTGLYIMRPVVKVVNVTQK